MSRSFARRARAIAAHHDTAFPSADRSQVAFGSAVTEPRVSEGVPCLVRLECDSDGLGAVSDEFVRAGVGERATLPEEELRRARRTVLATLAPVGEQCLRGLPTDRNDPPAAGPCRTRLRYMR
jgi:hypothetical protein